jgi:Small, acid-soluble spore proteins, alpha/beta type.
MGKKEKKIDLNNIKPEEAVKYEIASELGYLDKVMASGWKSLTAKESGRIGGIMTKKKREAKKNLEMNKTETNESIQL